MSSHKWNQKHHLHSIFLKPPTQLRELHSWPSIALVSSQLPRFSLSTWKWTMRFGYTAHAYQLTKATKRIVISSKSSETSITHLTALLPFKGTGKHTGSTKVKGQIREKKSCKGHRHCIGYGRNLGSRICTIAALRPCQFLTLVHPSQHSMPIKKLIMAGDRGGWMIFVQDSYDRILCPLR